MMLAHNFSIITFMSMLLEAISTTISMIALLLLVFGIPIMILRKWRAREPINDDLAIASFLWLVFATVSLAFSMVHIEARHALPVLPAALVCVVYTLQRLRARRDGTSARTGTADAVSVCLRTPFSGDSV